MASRLPPWIPRRPLAVVAFLLAASFVFHLPFFVEPPGRDQSLFLTEASLVLDGRALYLDVWEHKPPGVVLVYALGLAVLGRSYHVVPVLGWLSAWLTAVGLWAIVRRVTGRDAPGVIAGALYAFLQSGVAFSGFWSTAQAEVFMDPLLAGALWLLLPAREGEEEGPTPRALLAAGACLGGVLLLKYSALPVVVVAAGLGAARVSGVAARARVLAGLALGAGLAVAPVVLYLAVRGALGAFWDAASFNLEHQRVSALPRTEELGDHLLYEPALLAPLYAFAALGWGLLWRRAESARRALRDPGARLLLVATVLWAAALAEVLWQAKFWQYHFHVLLVPLCLGAAAGMALVSDLAGDRIPPARVALGCALAAAILLGPDVTATLAYARRHGLARRWSGALGQRECWATYRWGGRDYDPAETEAAAARVKEETRPGDAVFVWGFEAGVYFSSGRRPASRFLYDYPLMPAFRGVHERTLARLMDDLGRDPPALFVVVRNDVNALEPEDSATQLTHLAPLASYLHDGYEAAGEVGDFLFYRRRSVAAP